MIGARQVCSTFAICFAVLKHQKGGAPQGNSFGNVSSAIRMPDIISSSYEHQVLPYLGSLGGLVILPGSWSDKKQSTFTTDATF